MIILVNLEVKRIKRNSAYWLRLIGFDPETSRIYQIYVTLFWFFWIFSMWAFVVEQVYHASRQWAWQDSSLLLEILPRIVFFLQVAYLISVVWKLPLKMAAPDLAYVAASPVSRGAITLVYFTRSLFSPAVILSLLGSLIAMFIAWNTIIVGVGLIGVQAFFLSFCLVYCTASISWALALFKQRRRSVFRRYIFLLTIILLILLGLWLAPNVILWSSRVLAVAIQNKLSSTDVVLLGILLMMAFSALYGVGSKLPMTSIMDASHVYARIQKFGVLGQVMAPDVIARIRKQNQLSQKGSLLVHLPIVFGYRKILFGRTFVTLARLSPELGLRLIFTGFVLPSAVISIIKLGGYASFQTWLLVFIILLQLRPDNLTRFFRECINQPFLRQFLPANNLLLFVSHIALPLFFMSLGASFAVVLQTQFVLFEALGVWLLVIALVTVLGFCQALEYVRLPFYLSPSNSIQLNYEYTVIVLGALIVLAGTLLQSLWAAGLASIMILIVLSLLLYVSQ